jgi:hypothetical protein
MPRGTVFSAFRVIRTVNVAVDPLFAKVWSVGANPLLTARTRKKLLGADPLQGIRHVRRIAS